MTQVAKAHVWVSTDGGPNYVGRAPRGNFVKAHPRGTVLTDEQVAELGLADLEDHTDYDGILAEAKANGVPYTELSTDENGDPVVVVVGGPPEAEIVEEPHPYIPGATINVHKPAGGEA